MAFPTSLIYSSHDRCEYIHNHWIVQRALRGNKKILFLTFSESGNLEDPQHRQQWSWDNFAWFFRRFEADGLDAKPFFWRPDLRRDEVDYLMQELWSAEVVVLGGGSPTTGLMRYKDIGEHFYGERGCFGRILHERADRGLLTCGFSAGTDQLCEFMSSGIGRDLPDGKGFGMMRNLMATSHFEPGQEDHIAYGARQFPHCLLFGLPNDSGIGQSWGWTPGGNTWQLLHFITDNSWDIPQHAFHIKTRQGVKIPHMYPDGRYWGFSGGDQLLRIQSPDSSDQKAWILSAGGGPAYDWWTQTPTFFSNVPDMIAHH